MSGVTFKIEKSWSFVPEKGTIALDSKGNKVAIAVSRSSMRSTKKSEEAGFGYVVWKKGKVLMSWRFDSDKGLNCAAFHPTENLVIFGNDEGTLYVFTEDGDLIKTIELNSPVLSCAFSSSGERVALGFEGGKVSIRDSSFEPLWEYLTDDNVWSLSWSPDEKYLAVASHDNNLYILTKPKDVWRETFSTGVNRVHWCGEKLAAGTWDPGIVAVYNVSDPTSPEKLWEKELLSSVWGLSWNDACSHLAAGATNSVMKVFDTEGEAILSMELYPIDDLKWKGEFLTVAGKDHVDAFSMYTCTPFILPSFKRFKTYSLSQPGTVVEVSEALYLLMGRPKKVLVNGDELEVRVVPGNFLYIISPYDGEVEVEVP